MVYSDFSVGLVFVEKFAKQNSLFSEFFLGVVRGHVLGEDKFLANTQRIDNFVLRITPKILHLEKIWTMPRNGQVF